MRTGWLIAMAITVSGALAAAAADVAPSPLEIGSGERLLVIAPHPDDETLGAGGLMQRVRARGGTVRVVLVTAGDGYVEAVVHETGRPRPRPAQYVAYGERRLREVRAAMRQLGGDGLRLQFLGFPDGGIDGLLRAHWWRSRPERSATTGASDPPYDEALEPDVPYDGADLRRELVTVLRETQPTIVALPDPVDKHPDHHATALFTLLAMEECVGPGLNSQAVKPLAMPRVLAYLVHWPDWPPGWDAQPPLIAAGAPLELPRTLPPRAAARSVLTLTDAEVATKQAVLAKYASQQEVLGSLLAAFVRRTEPFTVLTATEMHAVEQMIERRWHRPLTPERR